MDQSGTVEGWTEARFWQFVRSNLRAAPYPPKFEALNRARRLYVPPPDAPKKKGGKQKWEYQCADCQQWFQAKFVSSDHIIPCGELNGWDDLLEFCKNLWCPLEGFQCLCDTCHGVKTYMERYGVSREAAIAKKDVIAFLKQKVQTQKDFLSQHGFRPAELRNKSTRELCFISLKEKLNGSEQVDK